MKRLLLAAAVLQILMFSCAYSKNVNVEPSFNDANKMIENAKAEGAAEFAPDNLALAEKAMSMAQSYLKSGNGERAEGFAKRAASDAETAIVYARINKLKAKLAEMKAQQNSN